LANPDDVGFLMDIRETSGRAESLAWTPSRLRSMLSSRLRAISLGQLGKQIWSDAIRDDYLDLAAQMSFYFSLSLFPFLIVIAALVGWLPSTTLWHNLAQWITDYLPRDSRSLVFMTILDLTQGSKGFLSFGLIATIWTASSGFVSLMESLTVAYGEKETRGFWKKRLIAICATVVGAFFFVMSFGLMTLGHWVASAISFHLQNFLPYQVQWELGRWLASLLLMLLGLDLTNYFLPNVKRPWHWLTPGSAFVVLTMVAGSAVFNFYLRHFGDYPKFYGALAGFIILLTWIYIASLLLLFGAETDSILEKLNNRGAAE
jgi:membrane protein